MATEELDYLKRYSPGQLEQQLRATRRGELSRSELAELAELRRESADS
jgi:hypothetical protein